MKKYRCLELFSGTGSVGKVFEKNGFEVISLDNEPRWNATHCCDIMDFDYKSYPSGYFDVIWASPPCTSFSSARWFGKRSKGVTDESLYNDIVNQGLPPLKKTLEIIKYLKPKIWFIENPQTGKMKEYLDLAYSDCAYCQYGMKYRKNTRIWNNIGLNLEKCRCRGHHLESILTYQKRDRYTDQKQVSNKFMTYVIPEKLVESIFDQTIKYLESK